MNTFLLTYALMMTQITNKTVHIIKDWVIYAVLEISVNAISEKSRHPGNWLPTLGP